MALLNGKSGRNRLLETGKLFWSTLILALLIALPGEGSPGVYLSIGSVHERAAAERCVKLLEKAGMKTWTKRVSIGDRVFTRITILKDYGTIPNAEKALAELKNNLLVKELGFATPWIFIGDPKATPRRKKITLPKGTPRKDTPVSITPPERKTVVRSTDLVLKKTDTAVEPVNKNIETVIEPVNKTDHRVISIGNAGVMDIIETKEKKPLEIVQIVPGQGNKVGSRGPLMVFLNERVYVPSISGNLEVVENGTPVAGTVNVLPSSGGNAILSYIPFNDFKKNSDINVRIKKGMKDSGGNTMTRDTSFQVSTGLFPDTGNDNNLGFERGTLNLAFQGDACVMKAPGGFDAPEGRHFAAISTGMIFTRKPALMHTTSMMTVGPINERIGELSFKYNFASAEFNDQIGSLFDDTAMLIITGTNANKVFMINSVNLAGYQKESLPYDFFPGFPDTGKSNGITGWKEFTVKDIDISGPVTLMFILSDVGDREFSSLLFIDDIRIKAVNP